MRLGVRHFRRLQIVMNKIFYFIILSFSMCPLPALASDRQLTSSELITIMQPIRSWPSSIEVTNKGGYISSDWSNLVSAAIVLQQCDSTSVEKVFNEWEACQIHDLDCGYLTGTKFNLVMRIVFEVPDTNETSSWDSAWPIDWNGGKPTLQPGPTSYNGRVFPASAGFKYFKSKYKYRDLSKFHLN
jgi:hypothetical protein